MGGEVLGDGGLSGSQGARVVDPVTGSSICTPGNSSAHNTKALHI